MLSRYSAMDEISDSSGFINVGNFIFNQPMTADEMMFLVYAFTLAAGGINMNDHVIQKSLYKLRPTDSLKPKYLTLRRAFVISQILLNKAI